MTVIKKNRKFFEFATNWRRFLSCLLFTLLEIFAAKLNLFDALLTKWRKPWLSREIQMLNILPSEKVLHLGCGAFPSATIFIAKERKVHVVGIDNNYITMKLARSYIKKKNLSDLVTIEYGDGTYYQVRDFDVIYIAINVWPIDKVLFLLAQTMKPTARILCKGSHHDINSLLKKKELQSLVSVSSTLEYPKIQSFLLRKNVNV
jgi:ubiquinone/menaquinone biosynthesis C-methylase UbiE